MMVEKEGEAVVGAASQIVGKCGKCEKRAHNPLTRLSPFYILARIGP